METRLVVSRKLNAICSNVYFQPPSTVKMQYPCIVYSYNIEDIVRADNLDYFSHDSYDIIVIDKNPLSTIPKQVKEAFKYSNIKKSYISDNLNHTPIKIYQTNKEE